MAYTHEFALMGHHPHQVSLLQRIGKRSHGAREHPWVKTPQTLLFASFEAYLR